MKSATAEYWQTETEHLAAPVLDVTVSMFANAMSIIPKDCLLSGVLRAIRDGRYEAQITRLRALSEDAYNKEKKRILPAFTMSGTAHRKKGESKVLAHSGLLQVDLDDLNGDLEAVREKVKLDPHVAFGFVSPSGHGLKLGLHIDDTRHAESFTAAQAYFQDRYGLTIDEMVKNPACLCFVSHDPELWTNPDAVLFQTSPPSPTTLCSHPFTSVPICSHTITYVTSASLSEDMEKAVQACLPEAAGQTHRKLFGLARMIRGIEQKSGATLAPAELKAICKRWCELATPFLRHGCDEYHFEFLEALECVRYPAGEQALAGAWERAQKCEPIPEVSALIESPDIRLLATLCRELQILRGDKPFLLPARVAQTLFRHPQPMTAWRWLNGLCRVGVLTKAKAGNHARREPNFYRYNLEIELMKTQTSEKEKLI
jgi:VirE-like protein